MPIGLHAVFVGVVALIAALNASHCSAAEPPVGVVLPQSDAIKADLAAENGGTAVDIRPFMQKWELEPRTQGGRGTCSVFAMTAALEYAAASKRQHGERLSVEYLNWAANKKSQSPIDGGNFSEIWKGYVAYGICPEAEMPYREQFTPACEPCKDAFDHAKEFAALGLHLHWIKEWNPRQGVSDEQLAEIKQTLKRNWPVCGGFLWPKRERWENEVLHTPKRKGVMDGHSVLLVGYRDDEKQPGGGVFLIRNSAGPSRDGLLPYDYARKYMNDAVWIDFPGAAEGGPCKEEINPPVQ